MKKKILVLVYKDCVAFEMAIATQLLHNSFEIVTVAPERGPLAEWSGLVLSSHHLISEVDINDFTALIIPGGKWQALLERPEVTELIKSAYEKGLTIGAICAAPVHLAKAGVLQGHKFTTTLKAEDTDLIPWNNYLEESVVIDGSIVTAKGNAYVDFGVELADILGVFSSNEQKEVYRKHYKNL